jgi:hypothetical protein
MVLSGLSAVEILLSDFFIRNWKSEKWNSKVLGVLSRREGLYFMVCVRQRRKERGANEVVGALL